MIYLFNTIEETKLIISINNIEKGDIAMKIINPMRYKNGDS